MGSTLKQNLSNAYYQRRNVLTASPNQVTVLVEDSTDISIWSRMLGRVCPHKQFNIHPYQVGMNKTQSKQLVIETIRDRGGDHYIGCVDSDLQGFLSPDLFYPNSYIFHTYVYSVENLFCMPETLAAVYTTATSYEGGFDFAVFFRSVSKIVYPLFVADLFLRSVGITDAHKVGDWKYVFPGEAAIKKEMRGTSKKNNLLEAVENSVNKYLKSIKNCKEYDIERALAFENELHVRFPYFTSDNCILFIYGHAVFDFVESIMKAQQAVDIDEEKQKILTDKGIKPEVKEQRLAEIVNRQHLIRTILRANFEFMHIGDIVYQKIEEDLLHLN